MTVGRRPAGFRRVWLGATISATGDAASWIALVALIVAAPRASITILAVCYTAPVAVGGLAAGWALDRFDRRRLLARRGRRGGAGHHTGGHGQSEKRGWNLMQCCDLRIGGVRIQHAGAGRRAGPA